MLEDSKHRNPLTHISVLGEQIGVFSSSQRMQHVFFKQFFDIQIHMQHPAPSVEHQQKSPLENAMLLKGVAIWYSGWQSSTPKNHPN